MLSSRTKCYHSSSVWILLSKSHCSDQGNYCHLVVIYCTEIIPTASILTEEVREELYWYFFSKKHVFEWLGFCNRIFCACAINELINKGKRNLFLHTVFNCSRIWLQMRVSPSVAWRGARLWGKPGGHKNPCLFPNATRMARLRRSALMMMTAAAMTTSER